MRRLVYIAAPYANGDPISNIRLTFLVADEILEHGGVPFLPLLWVFWHLVKPKRDKLIDELRAYMVTRCDAIFRLPGVSRGADLEVEAARESGIPVFYANDIAALKEYLSQDGR